MGAGGEQHTRFPDHLGLPEDNLAALSGLFLQVLALASRRDW